MYKKFVISSLILVYLVIIAGAVVRMTGSGMGCPDWPKCFGYIIPPTDREQLEFKSNHEYFEGQVIILDASLKVAQSNFKSGDSYDPTQWTTYTRHDYAVFNPWHTWIEYINRLAGALAGIVVFLMAASSFRYWSRSRRLVFLSWLAVFMMGFQGWLGATVVYSVLAPVRITVHMLVALLIVLLLIYLLYMTRSSTRDYTYDKTLAWGLGIALIFTLVQIALGTQVRQHVDEQVEQVGYTLKGLWLDDPGIDFYIHRSFSIIVFILNIYLFYRNRKLNLGHKLFTWVMALIVLEILTGIFMYYFDFPFLSQPLHLVIASVLFGLQSYLLLTSFKEKPRLQLASYG